MLDQVERYGRRTSGGGAVSIALTALGGAVNRVAPLATAFVHRRSRFLAQYTASWAAGGAGATQNAWLDGGAHGDAAVRLRGGVPELHRRRPSRTGARRTTGPARTG